MTQRIRSIKPEWLDDERMALASSDARVLSVALMLLADDHGRGRAALVMLAGRVFPGKPMEVLQGALSELAPWFVHLYEVDGQAYFEIRNWLKHQKVDKPGKPRVPAPLENLASRRETLDKYLDSLGSSRASRDPGPGPGPDPGQGPEPAPEPAPTVESEPEPELASETGAEQQTSAVHRRPDVFLASFAATNADDLWAFEQWKQAFGKAGADFDDGRARCLADRRLRGMTRQDVVDVIAGAKLDPYVIGEKDGQKHDRLSFIFGRDQDRYEEFLELGRSVRTGLARPVPKRRAGGRSAPLQHGGTSPLRALKSQ